MRLLARLDAAPPPPPSLRPVGSAAPGASTAGPLPSHPPVRPFSSPAADSRFTQQDLPAWRPTLTPATVRAPRRRPSPDSPRAAPPPPYAPTGRGRADARIVEPPRAPPDLPVPFRATDGTAPVRSSSRGLLGPIFSPLRRALSIHALLAYSAYIYIGRGDSLRRGRGVRPPSASCATPRARASWRCPGGTTTFPSARRVFSRRPMRFEPRRRRTARERRAR